MANDFQTKKVKTVIFELEYVNRTLTPVEVSSYTLFISSYDDLRQQLEEKLKDESYTTYVNDGNPINSKEIPKGFDWLVEVVKI